jgi:hypothetical protein
MEDEYKYLDNFDLELESKRKYLYFSNYRFKISKCFIILSQMIPGSSPII